MYVQFVVWCIFMLCLLSAAYFLRERFVGSGSSGSSGSRIVYASHLPNVSLWLSRIGSTWTQKNAGIDGMEILRSSLLKSRVPTPNVLEGHSSMMVTLDPYVYETKWKALALPLVATSPVGYIVAISSLTSAFTTECSYHLYGKRIGYVTESEWFLIHAILYSYHIPKTAVELVQMNADEILTLDEVMDVKVDVFITYIIPNSLYHAMLRLLPVSLMGWQNIDIERIRVFHPYVQKKTGLNIQQIFASPSPRSQMMVMAREENSALLSLSMNLYLVHGAPPSIQNSESFVSRLDVPEELTDPAFQCYGDLTVSQAAVCDSKYDVSGMPKSQDEMTVWDRPCFTNTECPYFQANKNYPNVRGGCVRGRCEFPIGVRRTSYRHYVSDAPYTPLCYQCKTMDDPACCAKQKDIRQYPKLKSPDYAFVGDTEARRKAKLPLFVPIV